MNFSILLASRERVPLLEGLLASIAANTDNLSNVEVLIGIDHDDGPTCAAQSTLTRRFPFAHFFRRHRSRNINNDYLNWLFHYSTGKYLIACNDDTAFLTKGWDSIIMNKLEYYLNDKPDGIVYGYISDNLNNRHGMQYCCFPLISRKGVNVLGYVLPGCFQGWNADIACWRVYEAVHRVCDLSGVLIDHISYHTGKRERDAISHHMEQISRESEMCGSQYDLSGDVMRLSNAMGAVSSLPVGKHGVVFSIIVPTRDRIDLLEGMLESVYRNTIKRQAVEVAVAYDTDDRKTNSAISRLVRKYGTMVRFYGRQRSNMINRDYMNWLYKFSKGTFMIFANDDCRFISPNWDQLVSGRLRQFLKDKPDGIVYGKFQDQMGTQHCWCPLVSRRAVEIIGYGMHPDIPGQGAEAHLWRIYNEVGRVCLLDNVEIEHLNKRDAVNMQVERLSSRIAFDPFTCDISNEVKLLGEHVRASAETEPAKQEKNKPHILCVTEKWCDGNPHMGATNNEHNLFGSLEVSDTATYDRLHIDEYRLTYGKNADEELLQRCMLRRPDVIVASYLFCSDFNISNNTWRQISDMGIPVVFFWYDMVLEDRMRFADTLVPFCAFNVVFDTDKYKTMHPERYLPMFTPQDTRYFFNSHSIRDVDVCFLGSMDGFKDRHIYMEALRNNGIETVQMGGQRETPLPLEAYTNLMQRSKICLNFPKQRGTGLIQAKGRIFEITSCGALMFDMDNDQTRRWFTPGDEYITFSNEQDLVEKVKHYLGNDGERGNVAHRGWIRSCTSYSPKMFWKCILERIGVV